LVCERSEHQKVIFKNCQLIKIFTTTLDFG